MIEAPSIHTALSHFAGLDAAATVERFGPGHINRSYLVTSGESPSRRYLLQQLNTSVFVRPTEVCENIERVTQHIATKLAERGIADAGRRVLRLIPTRDGAPGVIDGQGQHWRLFPFIEHTRTHTVVQNPRQAEQAAGAYGMFQTWLSDLPAPPLHETIRGFHDVAGRVQALWQAVAADGHNRAAEVRGELKQIEDAGDMAPLLDDSRVPQRVVHNDAKITNVLFDETDDSALCVIDLDTVMMGRAAFDFGDMMRSMATRADEDEPDLNRVTLDMTLFEALARGYIAAASFLTPPERDQLVSAGVAITFEQAVRFLTDYLHGDIYYSTSRPRHNLDRARAHLKLVDEFRRSEDAMRRYVERL